MVSALDAFDTLAAPGPALTYIARQVIRDASGRTWGYQILHRSEASQGGARNTLLTVGLDVGLSRVSSRHRILVELDGDALLARLPDTFAPSHLILDVPASLTTEPAIMSALERYAAAGYAIAIDVGREPLEDARPLALARILRIDAECLVSRRLAAFATAQRAAGKIVIATGVVDDTAYDHVRGLGIELFQGPHLRQPELMAGLRVAPERASALTLLAKLHNPDTTFADLSALIHRDPVLSFQLLRFVGSAALARPVRVDSVQRALLMLGLKTVRQWASLIVLSRAATHDEHALLLAMTRARMAEILATHMAKNPAAAFTVGLFSALEHLLGQPLRELLDTIPLDDDVCRALLGGPGYLGAILQAILLYEEGIVSGHDLGLASAHVASAYVDAIEWAEEARGQLAAS